jgi:hypothetical protein
VIAVASPSLWQPRMGAWWRLPSFLFTEGKAQRNDSTGKFKRNSSGKILKNSATSNTCCCTPPCAKCSGGTPATYTVTIAGITLCSCWQSPVNGKYYQVLGTVDGTYTLTSDGAGSCSWSYLTNDYAVIPVSVTGSNLVDCSSPCSTPASGTETFGGYQIGLTKTTTKLELVFYWILNYAGCTPAVNSIYDFFSGTTTTSLCTGTFVQNNLNTSAAGCATAGASGTIAGYGGTATITSA